MVAGGINTKDGTYTTLAREKINGVWYHFDKTLVGCKLAGVKKTTARGTISTAGAVKTGWSQR